LLAFDSRGHRLGYGAGNYDRTLQRLRARRGKDRPGVAAIGLAFDFQFAPLLPSEAHDQRLDWVLTPSGPRWLGD
jgi:5-formyltetrahydrofolate cyclo-ligase